MASGDQVAERQVRLSQKKTSYKMLLCHTSLKMPSSGKSGKACSNRISSEIKIQKKGEFQTSSRTAQVGWGWQNDGIAAPIRRKTLKRRTKRPHARIHVLSFHDEHAQFVSLHRKGNAIKQSC